MDDLHQIGSMVSMNNKFRYRLSEHAQSNVERCRCGGECIVRDSTAFCDTGKRYDGFECNSRDFGSGYWYRSPECDMRYIAKLEYENKSLIEQSEKALAEVSRLRVALAEAYEAVHEHCGMMAIDPGPTYGWVKVECKDCQRTQCVVQRYPLEV
jgi:hypothetical protein